MTSTLGTGGQIRSSLTSVPSRGLLLAVKAAVVALVAVPTTVASFALTRAGLGYGADDER